jgi:hypothetical protein
MQRTRQKHNAAFKAKAALAAVKDDRRASALSQTDVTGSRLSLPRMASADRGPDEGFWAGVVLGEISIDGGLQIGDRAEDAAADALARHLGKEVLDRVEPRGRGRGEVKGFSPTALFAREIIQKTGNLINANITLSDLCLMLSIGGFDFAR